MQNPSQAFAAFVPVENRVIGITYGIFETPPEPIPENPEDEE